MVAMSASRSKTAIRGFLVISLLCCVLGTVAFAWYRKTTACFHNLPPLRSFLVTVSSHQERWIIKPAQDFADKNGFRFDISYYDQHGREFSIWMERKDVQVIIDNVIDLEEFDVAFYNNDCIHPTVASDIVDLEADLKSLINNEIPNAMITEQRSRLTIPTDKNWRDEELFSRMKVLAEKHSLEYQLSFYGSDPSDKTCFQVEIQGEGFHIISDCAHNTLEEININFYLDYYQSPTVTSQETLDGLFDELKSLLSEIPNVTIAEEQ
jgi:hypothetical protein